MSRPLRDGTDGATEDGTDGTPEEVQVVVVGGGPTGITVAKLLGQYGVSCVVLEKFTEPYPLPRAVHADDEVARILQQLGLADGFAAISRPVAGMRLLDADRSVLAEFARDRGPGALGHPQSSLYDQPDLERLLRASLTSLPNIDLRLGAELTSLEQTPTQALVTYRRSDGRAHQLRAQAVLGCDGANSVVRQLIGARLVDLRFVQRWLVVDVHCPTPLGGWDGVEQVCDPRRPATYLQVGPQRYRWEFRMLPGEDVGALTSEGSLAVLLAPWTAGVPASDLTVVRAAAYTFKARVADRWREGRVFLLGDAAHLTPPFIGQGLGSGLRDAHNLAWKLALVLRHGASPRLLDTYQAERKPAARALIRAAVLVGAVMTGGHDLAATARSVALRALCQVPGGTSILARTVTPRLRRGPLVRPTRLRRGTAREPAGRLCPQPMATDDTGRRVRLDDLLGTGYAVVSDGPVDAGLVALGYRLAGGLGLILVDAQRAAASELVGWLRQQKAGAVLVRPDRMVAAAAPRR